MSSSKIQSGEINLPKPEVTTLDAYRPNPIRDDANKELLHEMYSHFLQPGESLEECEVRLTKEMRESRKASLRLLSEKSGMVKPGIFRKRKVKEQPFVPGSVTMDYLIENDFTQEKSLNVVISRIGNPALKGCLHIVISSKTENECRTVVVRSEPCLIDTGYVYFVLLPVNVKDDNVTCVESNVLDDLVRTYTVPNDQTFEVICVPHYHRETPVRSNVISGFLQQQFPELVQRINDVCSDKPAVVVTPRHPHASSFFAGSVAMNNEVDFMLSINKEQIYGDTHFAIHQPKKRSGGLQGVQLKQQPKNVFVQLGNGATYWAANHHHAQTIHRIITAETKQMYAKCYKTWKDNV